MGGGSTRRSDGSIPIGTRVETGASAGCTALVEASRVAATTVVGRVIS